MGTSSKWVLRAAVLLTTIVALATCSPALAAWHHRGHRHGFPGSPAFTNTVFASGVQLTHQTPAGPEGITQPDDITYLHDHIFAGFQNGVGPQGQPSTTGNADSTIVEFNLAGRAVEEWDVVGKCDGVTADPRTDELIATVNEDANSSVYLIDPKPGSTPVHYQYSESLPHNGGTDAIEIYHGMVLISGSAPGTTGTLSAPQPTFPAVYEVSFDSGDDIATVSPLFFDEDPATVANTNRADSGQTVDLALTDPDSNEDVPWYARRFAGEFMLTSQGDQQQIFVSHAGTPRQSLSVLNLTASVDDTAWPSTPSGAIYTTDNSNDTINRITGPFVPGSVFAAVTPCDENIAPATCPGPGFPPNYLGEINPWTGDITAVDVSGPAFEPQGMLFLPRTPLRRW